MKKSNNENDWYLIKKDAEERTGKDIKKLMQNNNMTKAVAIVHYDKVSSDKGRDIVVTSSEVFADKSELEAKEEKEKKPKKKTSAPWASLNITDEEVYAIFGMMEELGPYYGNNNTDMFRKITNTIITPSRNLPEFLLKDQDGTSSISRNMLDMLIGKKYPDIAEQFVLTSGDTVKNMPTEQAWIDRDYRRGYISDKSAKRENANGTINPIYYHDRRVDSPYKGMNDMSLEDFLKSANIPDDMKDTILRLHHINDTTNNNYRKEER